VLERSATRDPDTATVTCKVAVEPAAIELRFHVTVPAEWVPPPVAETNVVPAGTGSETETPDASEGPALWTTMVYERLVPAVTGSVSAVLTTDTSARTWTVVASVALLFAALGSAVEEDTVAVLDRSAVRDGFTATTI
jgi:hypothetical protein